MRKLLVFAFVGLSALLTTAAVMSTEPSPPDQMETSYQVAGFDVQGIQADYTFIKTTVDDRADVPIIEPGTGIVYYSKEAVPAWWGCDGFIPIDTYTGADEQATIQRKRELPQKYRQVTKHYNCDEVTRPASSAECKTSATLQTLYAQFKE